MNVSHVGKVRNACIQNLNRRKFVSSSKDNPGVQKRFKVPDDFITPSSSRLESSLSKPTWAPPSWRLTGAISKKEDVDSLLKELKASQVHIAAFSKTFFSLKLREIEGRAVYYRNILTKAIWLDDLNRIEQGVSLFGPNAQNLLVRLNGFLDQVAIFISDHAKDIEKKKCYGQLTRIFTALKFRLAQVEANLTEEEKADLLLLLTELRKKEALHLVSSAKVKLLDIDVQQFKKATLEERYKQLDLLIPLNIGISTQELTSFVSLLDPVVQNQLLPLIDLRNQLVTNDSIWNQLVDKALEAKEKIALSLQSVEERVNRDLAYFEAHPAFGRLLLKHGTHFSDDLFVNTYVMKIIDLDAYFRSPHIVILLEEQHLNRQIFAAKDQVKQSEMDQNLLMVQSHLKLKSCWMYVNEVPFVNVYVADEFQRLLSVENQRFFNNAESSSQTEGNKIYYLPKRGLINQNPHYIPENIHDLVHFDFSDLPDSFTPAISYNKEKATVTGTHAFTEVYFDHKRFIIGKFLSLAHTYSKVDTYWKFFRNVIQGILSPQKSILLSPDQNTGYPDRLIATLDTPFRLSPEQKQKIFDILSQFRNDHGVCGRESKRVCQFVGHTNNCTGLTEEMLKAVGVDLPCIAPLHALLIIDQSRWAGLVQWIIQHPYLADPFLNVLGMFLGAKGDRLSTKTLEAIMTPYIPRIYVALKNSTDPWLDQINKS